MSQYGRRVVIQVTDRAANITGKTAKGDPISSADRVTIIDTKYSDLKVEFSFSKKLDSSESTDTGSIVIHNLTPETVKGLGKKYSEVTIACCYDDDSDEPLNIFKGDITGIEYVRIKGSNTCKIEMSSSEILLNHQYKFSRSFPEDTAFVQVVADLVKYFGIDVYNFPIEDDRIDYWSNLKFPHGVSFNGSIKEIFDALFRPLGLTWKYIDGQYLLITEAKIVPSVTSSDDNTIVLTEDTGLIGYPNIKTQDYTKSIDDAIEDNELFVKDKESKPAKDGTPKAPKKKVVRKFGVEFKCLINPAININSVIRIGTATGITDGLYRVRDIKVDGDTRGQSWYMSCFAENIGY